MLRKKRINEIINDEKTGKVLRKKKEITNNEKKRESGKRGSEKRQ